MKHNALRILGRLMFAFGVLISMNACGAGIDEAVWTEQVKLHDGRMIEVWRRATAYAGGFPNSKRGSDIDFEFKYAPLRVHWKGSWELEPAAFEIFDNVPYLVLYVKNGMLCKSKAALDYAAQFLRWENGMWKEISQTEFPADRAIMNLYIGYWGQGPNDKELPDAKGLITWERKSIRDGFLPDQPETVKSSFERRHLLCNLFSRNKL